MKLRKINIAKDVEEVMNTKSIIDEYWINVTKETTQKTSVEEFVTRLDMAKTLYMSSKGDVVPFKHFDIDGTMYFFYVFLGTLTHLLLNIVLYLLHLRKNII